MLDKPLVSVVIANWNRKDDLREAIKSIYNQTYKNVEIIVVDNHSTDGSIEMVRKEFPNVKLIVMPDSSYGACETLNIGMASASGEYVVVIDNDTVLEKTWIELAVKKFKQSKRVGIIGGKIINYYTKNVEWVYTRPVEEWIDKEFKTTVFHGAAVALRKDIIDKVGYYPKNYFIYGNEFALSAKVINAGYDVIYYPKLIAYHKANYIFKKSEKLFYYSTRNTLQNILKYLPIRIAIKSLFVTLIGQIGALLLLYRNRKYIKEYIKCLIDIVFMLPEIIKNRQPISNLEILDYGVKGSLKEAINKLLRSYQNIRKYMELRGLKEN